MIIELLFRKKADGAISTIGMVCFTDVAEFIRNVQRMNPESEVFLRIIQ